MKFGTSHPLYSDLVQAGVGLGYTEIHALNEGRYAELAERLQAAAQRQRYFYGFLHGSMSVMLLYRIGGAISTGSVDDIVWACIMAPVLAFSIPRYRKQQRAAVAAVSRLRQAVCAESVGGAACT